MKMIEVLRTCTHCLDVIRFCDGGELADLSDPSLGSATLIDLAGSVVEAMVTIDCNRCGCVNGVEQCRG